MLILLTIPGSAPIGNCAVVGRPSLSGGSGGGSKEVTPVSP